MNIISINNISFCANFLADANVMKYNRRKSSYVPENVSFVEINPYSNKDVEVMDSISKSWKKAKYCYDYKNTVEMIHYGLMGGDKIKVYDLTSQLDDFEYLDSKKILGFADVTYNKNEMHLKFLETNPKYVHNPNKKTQYKRVGTAMLDSLKGLCVGPYNCIKLDSVNDSRKFYEKNDFKKSPNKEFDKEMIWERQA